MESCLSERMMDKACDWLAWPVDLAAKSRAPRPVKLALVVAGFLAMILMAIPVFFVFIAATATSVWEISGESE